MSLSHYDYYISRFSSFLPSELRHGLSLRWCTVRSKWSNRRKNRAAAEEEKNMSVSCSLVFSFLMIMIVDVRCLSSLTSSPRCFWYWWYYVYLRVLPTRRTYKYTYEIMLKSSFYRCLHCVLFALCLPSITLSRGRLRSFASFFSSPVSIPIENGGDGDVEYNRIWRRCRRRRGSVWLFAFEKYCIVF